MSSFGSFEKTPDGKDEWLTPPEIVRALGVFDLDPCSPINPPWHLASQEFSVHKDGLRQPWEGRVWLNPPYGGQAIHWMSRLADHGDGIALICARTETRMFFEHVWPRADGIFFFKGRLTFHHVNGMKAAGCIGAPSCLIAYGSRNVDAIAAAHKAGAIAGCLIWLGNLKSENPK